ncbi:unnamed protein product [Chilo suppressalis]|uniref:THAP-type domain-containing protein n=1 Tax=Chilo suppressalis TaxID=168631 RepID=A0ABN8L4S2_CHISP|nr:unnamed protein product [Chilo suppressalis]
MPQCVFKTCKNNYRKTNTAVGVSYFRFPSSPLKCAKWASIVAKERGEEFYEPAKNSVICSEHFHELDMIGHASRRRLIGSAVPKLPPLTETSSLVITSKVTNNQEQVQPVYVLTSPIASLADLISVPETPTKRFLDKQLLIARKIVDRKSKKIQTLQKANKTLVKKVDYMKTIIKLLKIKYKNTRQDLLSFLKKRPNCKC